MKANKDNYDSIGLDDNNAKITINEKKDNKPVTNTKEAETQENNGISNVFNKVKNLFNKNDSGENKHAALQEEEKQVETSATGASNTGDVSCKKKILTKLQDSIEIEKSYTAFFSLLAVGVVLLCLSLVFLPIVIISPSKFIMCFAFGSLIILSSFIFVYGTKTYFEKLFSEHRFIFTILFLCSIILGLYCSIFNHYLLGLLCAVFQLISLIVFTLSFIPGGKNGIAMIGRMLKSPFLGMWLRLKGQSYLPS